MTSWGAISLEGSFADMLLAVMVRGLESNGFRTIQELDFRVAPPNIEVGVRERV